jgi:uncharacterized phage infection (PIP) family protein YhgE
MNLDEKIARSIEPLREELLALFQDGPDDASELLGLLNYLVDQVPLLQDIKTEIKQLQNNQVPQPEERKDEPEDDPRTDPPPSDPELPDLRQRAKDVVKGLDKTKRVTSALRKLLPSEDDPIPDWIKDVPWYDLVSDIYKVYKFKQIVDQSSFTTQDVLKAFMSGKDEWHKFQEEHFDEVLKILGDGVDLLNSDMEDLLSQKLPGLFQIGENVSDSLQTCCQNQTSGFQTVEDQNDTTHSKLDGISSSLGPLGDGIDLIKDQNDTTHSKLGEISSSLGPLGDGIDLLKDQNDTTHSKLDGISSSLGPLGDGIDLIKDQNDTTSSKLDGISSSLGPLGDGIDLLRDQNDTTHSKLDEISSSLGPQPNFDLMNLPSYLHNETTMLRGFL